METNDLFIKVKTTIELTQKWGLCCWYLKATNNNVFVEHLIDPQNRIGVPYVTKIERVTQHITWLTVCVCASCVFSNALSSYDLSKFPFAQSKICFSNNTYTSEIYLSDWHLPSHFTFGSFPSEALNFGNNVNVCVLLNNFIGTSQTNSQIYGSIKISDCSGATKALQLNSVTFVNVNPVRAG